MAIQFCALCCSSGTLSLTYGQILCCAVCRGRLRLGFSADETYDAHLNGCAACSDSEDAFDRGQTADILIRIPA